MTLFIDKTNRVADLRIVDEDNGVDWSIDFFDVGALEHRYVETALDDAYVVDDIDYLIDQANDMIQGLGDFLENGPSENNRLEVEDIDNGDARIDPADASDPSNVPTDDTGPTR
ncbi:hypothetical protein BLEM_2083 [Bifidobacterium lemurum]|uniref:Uncharacterized protein n=1 Tax=Bifidobacterium lemurum TaxID=1603886 RepID=A0A261FLD4_9BIFI|nr:hypothetical protein [Bifidobacterium lemurum]OZG59908.1 hypothetical protein BLEM_2083 [Bifidobacterium lemurum]QOL33934.1 hypothetical protein BL8807_09240 [Bifidobacterium lemurum]